MHSADIVFERDHSDNPKLYCNYMHTSNCPETTTITYLEFLVVRHKPHGHVSALERIVFLYRARLRSSEHLESPKQIPTS